MRAGTDGDVVGDWNIAACVAGDVRGGEILFASSVGGAWKGRGKGEGEHTGTGPLSLNDRVYLTGFGVMKGSVNGSHAWYDTPATMMDFRYPWAKAPGASRSAAARKEVQCIVELVLAEELEEEGKIAVRAAAAFIDMGGGPDVFPRFPGWATSGVAIAR